jgi:drug/metabolite transporter (DMT)-like permease
MLRELSPRLGAVLLALLVTLLWSTSWVLIRIGLEDMPPLSFAGLRYTLAFLCLLPFAIGGRQLAPLRRARLGTWLRLGFLGVLFYAVTQGAQFLSLFYLPASMTGLVLSFTTILVAFLGATFLRERPTIAQWTGAVVYLVGACVYLYPISLPRGELVGLVAAFTGMLANALSSVLGRYVNRGEDLSPLAITVVTMGIGSVLLLAVGIAVQGLPRLTLANWAIVLWLAVVNSALAYTLWNRTLRTLSAMESSMINNTMLFQIAVLAWLFLGEQLTLAEAAGIVLAVVGTLVVSRQSVGKSRRLQIDAEGRRPGQGQERA